MCWEGYSYDGPDEAPIDELDGFASSEPLAVSVSSEPEKVPSLWVRFKQALGLGQDAQ